MIMNKGIKNIALILLCSTLSAVGAVGLYSHFTQRSGRVIGNESEECTHTSSLGQPRMSAVAYSSAHTPEDFADIAEQSLNGVVNIRCELSRASRRPQYIDPFEFLFGPGFGGSMPQQAPSRPRMSIGSGVIISEDGYIITNNHVVENASRITVNTNDNRELEAKIIGTDPSTDLALLKVEAKGLYPLPFGDSEALRIGEWVLAIGNPFNLSSTVTAGIVSAKGRSTIDEGEMKIASFIQTDAAVNPGNSGGALVNTHGELIGINTMIYSQTGNYAGYSFAIPASIAQKVVADLKKYGTVQRAVLGIVGTNIVSELTKKYELKVTEGAVVVDFADVSSAKSAGVKEGDVITRINGTTVRNMAEVQEQISKYRPGDKVELTLDRKGQKVVVNVLLKNNQGNTEIVKGVSPGSIGAAFKPLSPSTRERLGIDYGVEVVGVDKGKFREAGITKGFIILSINNVKVRTAEQVEQIVSEVISSSPDKVLFVKGAYPNGRLKYLAIDLGN